MRLLISVSAVPTDFPKKLKFSFFNSIEFDRDSEFFAIAGVTKKIKIYEYSIVRDAVVDLHYPITEMICESKIRYVGCRSRFLS